MFGKLREIQQGLDRIRTGRKNRNIPVEIAETINQHNKKVAKAASIYGRHFPNLNMEKLIKMGKWHDVPEYKEKDYVPGEITKEEKYKREMTVIVELQEYFGEECDLCSIWMEFEEEKTPEAILVKQLDQLDAAIQAMEYEKLGYDNVTNFYPYAMGKLSDPVLIKILNILLKKEYPHIDAYNQYFALLKCNGDENVFKEQMVKISK